VRAPDVRLLDGALLFDLLLLDGALGANPRFLGLALALGLLEWDLRHEENE
jgi:hypothetical protein